MRISLPKEGSGTRTELALRCYRRHALGDVLEYWPSAEEEPAGTSFGKVMHSGVAAHWRQEFNLGEDNPYAVMSAKYDRLRAAIEVDDRLSDDLANTMLRHYMANAVPASGHWAAGQEGWAVATLPGSDGGTPLIEYRLEVETPGGYRFRMQCDRCVVLPSHDIYVVADYKSAGASRGKPKLYVPPGMASWDEQWMQSVQMRMYKWGMQKVLDAPVDVMVEGQCKHPETFLQLVPCPDWSEERLMEAVMLFEDVCKRDTELIEHCMLDGAVDMDMLFERALNFTPCNYKDCYQYFHPCEYLHICNAQPSERLGLLKARYRAFEGEW